MLSDFSYVKLTRAKTFLLRFRVLRLVLPINKKISRTSIRPRFVGSHFHVLFVLMWSSCTDQANRQICGIKCLEVVFDQPSLSLYFRLDQPLVEVVYDQPTSTSVYFGILCWCLIGLTNIRELKLF